MINHSKKILIFIKKEEVVTSQEIAKLLEVSWNTADSWLKELLIEGKIRRIKKGGANLWLPK
ncbi:MAG TPA: FaeA/PapI family transcriptional regulator [Candidatus Nanoarchaeia archaeon]|nr:FaeA/PapI family transcriptional regulator [Candidatus Nanoarchaeia archaeon]